MATTEKIEKIDMKTELFSSMFIKYIENINTLENKMNGLSFFLISSI